MRLSISNIAWEKHDDQGILKILKSHGVCGIEVAPTKIWNNWKGASYQKARKYRQFMEEQGFKLPAMQAILFGKPELQLFQPTSYPSFFDHIKLLAELAQGFDSYTLVFGSPKNRKRGGVPYSEAIRMATDFFYKAGEICEEYECCIGLEHNPVEYGCDFVTDIFEAEELVERVNHPCFKLHLDSGGIHMCGENMDQILSQVKEFIHYHISEPMLEPIYGGVVDHKGNLEALKTIGYTDWVSIEMKPPPSVDLLELSVIHMNHIISGGHK